MRFVLEVLLNNEGRWFKVSPVSTTLFMNRFRSSLLMVERLMVEKYMI